MQPGQGTLDDAHAVLCLPGGPCAVTDGHLYHLEPQVAGGHGDEAVHAAELEGNGKGHFAPHQAKGAAGVADGILEKPAAAHPPDRRAGLADKVVLAAVAAVALDKVGPGLAQAGEHRGYFSGIVLKVGIKHGDQTTSAGAEPGVEGGGLAVPAAFGGVAHGNAAEPGATGHHFHHPDAGGVGGAVVDDDDLEGDAGRRQCGLYFVNERLNVFLFVVSRGDHGEFEANAEVKGGFGAAEGHPANDSAGHEGGMTRGRTVPRRAGLCRRAPTGVVSMTFKRPEGVKGLPATPIKFVMEDPLGLTGKGEAEMVLKGGKGASLLEIALDHGINIEHACGGVCACSTCHIYVEKGMDQVTGSTEAEEDRVEEAPGLQRNSRLSCQCLIQGEGLIVVRIPSWNRNAVKEEAH